MRSSLSAAFAARSYSGAGATTAGTHGYDRRADLARFDARKAWLRSARTPGQPAAAHPPARTRPSSSLDGLRCWGSQHQPDELRRASFWRPEMIRNAPKSQVPPYAIGINVFNLVTATDVAHTPRRQRSRPLFLIQTDPVQDVTVTSDGGDMAPSDVAIGRAAP